MCAGRCFSTEKIQPRKSNAHQDRWELPSLNSDSCDFSKKNDGRRELCPTRSITGHHIITHQVIFPCTSVATYIGRGNNERKLIHSSVWSSRTLLDTVYLDIITTTRSLRRTRFQEARLDVRPVQRQHPAALVRFVGRIQERRVFALQQHLFVDELDAG